MDDETSHHDDRECASNNTDNIPFDVIGKGGLVGAAAYIIRGHSDNISENKTHDIIPEVIITIGDAFKNGHKDEKDEKGENDGT